MEKQHTYRGYTFNITVTLDHIVEKRINGKRLHHIRFNDMGASNYYVTKQVETLQLENTILSMIDNANEWVDKREDKELTLEEQILINLGFKK